MHDILSTATRHKIHPNEQKKRGRKTNMTHQRRGTKRQNNQSRIHFQTEQNRTEQKGRSGTGENAKQRQPTNNSREREREKESEDTCGSLISSRENAEKTETGKQ